MSLDPELARLVDRVKSAAADGTPLAIRGGGTKDFYGERPQGEPLDMRGVAGITSHEPTELVVTVRGGTPLAELEAALAAAGQSLAFEPPRYAPGGSVGGMVAAGLSGPSRAAVGAVRDFVLGATIVNGRGELLSFGGQVMKNVAGYDVSRLLAGSMGILGVIVEVSLKVLPIAPATATVRFDADEADALARLAAWGREPLPIHASAWWSGTLVLRLAGARAAVDAALARFAKEGGEAIEAAAAEPFWVGLRDHGDEFFVAARRTIEADPAAALWRLGVPQTAPALGLPGETLVEWGGAQRWLVSSAPAESIREAARHAGGHATRFASKAREPGVFAPLAPPLDRVHRELKAAFDPAGILNPGRLYPGL